MIKNATLISAAVTTIVLVTLAGVAYAYKELITPPTPSTPSTSSISPQAVVFPLIASVPTNIPVISPQDAASIAVKFANRSDIYSVELADFNGSQTYKLTFSSGDVIYVAMNGQVVGSAPPSQSVAASPTTQPPPAVIYTGPIKKKATAGGGGDNSSGGGGGGGEHEGGGD